MEDLPQLGFIKQEVRGQYPGMVVINMEKQEERHHYGVACKHVTEGGEVGILKRRKELVA